MINDRFTQAHLDDWRRDGVALLPEFFTKEEVTAVAEDFRKIFPHPKDMEVVNNKSEGEIGAFDKAQFNNFDNIPLDCSPALNLAGVHPELVKLARAALKTSEVQLYQCQVWSKFTGESDFDQPFHCDYGNHTLTVPSENECLNAITFFIYFSDVSEAHGPTHYVTRRESLNAGIPPATFGEDLTKQGELALLARSSAAPAGSIMAYSIDVFHRGTNLTAPGGHRYAMTACFKRSNNEGIGYMAWAFQHERPWHIIFDHASPDQLNCFGVPRPGDAFWTEHTLETAQKRYPGWDMSAYRESIH